MAITIKPKNSVVSIPSLGKTKIIAEVEGTTDKNEKKLKWSAAEGVIDANGNYTAPKASMADIVDTVTIVSAKDETISATVTINVEAEVDYKEFIRKCEIIPVGTKGRYNLEFQCTNHFGFGNRCSIILTDYDQDLESIFPPAGNSPPVAVWGSHLIRVKTSSKGFVSIPLKKFLQRKRKLHARIKGTPIGCEITLNGPEETIKFNLNGGFWENIDANC